jgi:hypothetical protein
MRAIASAESSRLTSSRARPAQVAHSIARHVAASGGTSHHNTDMDTPVSSNESDRFRVRAGW